MSDQEIFKQLLDYYQHFSYDDSFDNVHERYSKIVALNVFGDWKGLYIEICRYVPIEDEHYVQWMLPMVFGAHNEKIAQAKREFEIHYFGQVLDD